jgi:hypothetical protein
MTAARTLTFDKDKIAGRPPRPFSTNSPTSGAITG